MPDRDSDPTNAKTKRKPYEAPRITEEEVFEREALVAGGKTGPAQRCTVIVS